MYTLCFLCFVWRTLGKGALGADAEGALCCCCRAALKAPLRRWDFMRRFTLSSGYVGLYRRSIRAVKAMHSSRTFSRRMSVAIDTCCKK
jgi:hypothetical protein